MRPFLIRGPENQTSLVGTSVTFQCRVGGEPLPDVLWRRTASGGNMPLGECFSILSIFFCHPWWRRYANVRNGTIDRNFYC